MQTRDATAARTQITQLKDNSRWGNSRRLRQSRTNAQRKLLKLRSPRRASLYQGDQEVPFAQAQILTKLVAIKAVSSSIFMMLNRLPRSLNFHQTSQTSLMLTCQEG